MTSPPSFPPPTPTGIAGVRSSTIFFFAMCDATKWEMLGDTAMFMDTFSTSNWLVRLQFSCAHWARSVDWQLLEIGTDLRGDEERETTIPILRDSNLLQKGCELDMTQRAPKNVNVTKLSWIINWFTYCKKNCWLKLFGYRNSSKWFWLFLLTKTVQYCLIILIYHNFT